MLKPPIERLADSVDDVAEDLASVVDWARTSRSRLGYFAALYGRVTLELRKGIQARQFDDNERMERLGMIFANRYLQALIDLRRGSPPGRLWAYSFDSAESYWPIVLQHLLLGMHAHINLDLGIAAAETMRSGTLAELHADFDRINAILAALIDGVQKQLANVWLSLKVFNSILGNVDDGLIQFSMNRARDEAWQSAVRLAVLPAGAWPQAIREQDERMMGLARLVLRPGLYLATVTKIVRLGEVQEVTRVIDLLS